MSSAGIPMAQRARANRPGLTRPSLCQGLCQGLCLALALAACGGSRPRQRAPRALPAVRSVVVAAGSESPEHYEGTVVAEARRPLGFELGGTIAHVWVQRGAAVHAGQLLATLDQTAVRARLHAARAALSQAAREVKLSERLVASGAGAATGHDNAVDRAELAVADRELADSQVDQTTLLAPVSGRIIDVIRHEREPVQPGAAVLVMEDASRHIEISLSYAETHRLAVADPVLIEVADATVPAHVRSVDSAADPDGMYDAEIAPDAPSPLLDRTGMLVRVRSLSEQPQILLVPLDAIVRRSGAHCVFLLDGPPGGATAHARAVTLGTSNESLVAIRQGLRSGDRIVAEGAYFLADGQRVSYQ